MMHDPLPRARRRNPHGKIHALTLHDSLSFPGELVGRAFCTGGSVRNPHPSEWAELPAFDMGDADACETCKAALRPGYLLGLGVKVAP